VHFCVVFGELTQSLDMLRIWILEETLVRRSGTSHCTGKCFTVLLGKSIKKTCHPLC